MTVLVTIWSLRLGAHIAIRTAGIADDPRYAAFAREWGTDSPRRMFVFLQNQALGSIPLVFAIFVAAHVPGDGLRLADYLGALILLAGIIFWIRFTYPRFREDQLQRFAWKVLIPLALANIMVTAVLKVAF